MIDKLKKMCDVTFIKSVMVGVANTLFGTIQSAFVTFRKCLKRSFEVQNQLAPCHFPQ